MEAVDARHLCVDFGVNHSPGRRGGWFAQALNAIDFPSLEAHVAPEKKKGIASRLFGAWGRKK
jgi:hypothetical protein